MRIFVGEYACGGGFADQPFDAIPTSLLDEGTAIWRAVMEDLAKIGTVVTPVDVRWNLTCPDAVSVPIQPSCQGSSRESLRQAWIPIARDCDVAIVIAPETDGILADAIAGLRGAGVNVLAPHDDVIRIASDKLLTAERMASAGVPHPLSFTRSSPPEGAASRSESGWIVKPRDGCGSSEVRRYQDFAGALEAMSPTDLLQQQVTGEAVSMLAVTSTQGVTTYLPGVRQTMTACTSGSGHATLHYRGGCGPVGADDQVRMETLAKRAAEALVSPLTGFVGFDMILGREPSDDRLIEINPRLATSYVGLRSIVDENLAQRLFLAQNAPIVTTRSSDRIHWDTRGRRWSGCGNRFKTLV